MSIIQHDNEVAHLAFEQSARMQHQLSLIAAENIVSEDVLAALGSCFTNKTVEGTSSSRYHSGSEVVDRLELLTRERAQRVFGTGYANVQPHSGTQANQIALSALAPAGATILSMSLADGGHLSHGHRKSLAGQIYRIVTYPVSEHDDRIDLNLVREMARRCSPAVIIAGASSYCRDIDYGGFSDIAREVGSRLLVDCAHFAGLIAGGALQSPIPYADVVTMSCYKTLRGPRGGLLVSRDESLGAAFDQAVFPRHQGTPQLNNLAAKAICLNEAASDSFKDYCVAAISSGKALADALQDQNVSLVTGHTDTSMLLLDLRHSEFSGRDVSDRLEQLGLLVNRNMVPRDPRKSSETSGVRVSTAGLVSRGLPISAICSLAPIIATCVRGPLKTQEAERWSLIIRELCQSWPVAHSGARLPAPDSELA